VYVTDKTGNRKSVYRSDPSWTRKKHAEIAQTEFLQKSLHPEPTTFNEVVKDYMEVRSLTVKKYTAYNMQHLIERHICPVFGKMRLDRITIKDIQTWQRTLVMSSYSDSLICKVQKFFKSIMHHAYLHDYILKDPCRTMKIAKKDEIPSNDHRLLSPVEFNHFLSVVDDPMYKTFYMVLYWCGLRFGEASALTFEDVNLAKSSLTVNKTYNYYFKASSSPKSKNSHRTVEMPLAVAQQLNQLLKMYNVHYDHDMTCRIFPIATIPLAHRRLDKWVELSGVERFTHHDLRHSCVSLLASAGFNDFQAAKRMGHDVKMFNEVYGHLFDSDQKKMTKAMDKMAKN
jgi:integrase